VVSLGSGQGPLAGFCECGDEPSGSGTTELFIYVLRFDINIVVHYHNINS
jgi:hypothetical protein